MLAKAMRAGFANKGTRMIAVRMALCAAMEIIRARRRVPRSRALLCIAFHETAL